ncbi:hypothetical protein, partial [Pseudomonas aeruginosa]
MNRLVRVWNRFEEGAIAFLLHHRDTPGGPARRLAP